MTPSFLNHLRVNPDGQQMAGGSVPQVVEVDRFRDAGPLTNRMPGSAVNVAAALVMPEGISLSPDPAPPVNRGEPFRTIPQRLPPSSAGRLFDSQKQARTLMALREMCGSRFVVESWATSQVPEFLVGYCGIRQARCSQMAKSSMVSSRCTNHNANRSR